MRKLLLSVEMIGRSMFEELVRTFPIACASDEFFYFPQVRLPEPRWSTWDYFSSDTVTEFEPLWSHWEDELAGLDSGKPSLEVQTDIAILQSIARTLREQLSEVRSWKFQPPFLF